MSRVGWEPAFIGVALVLSSLIIIMSAVIGGLVYWLAHGFLVVGATIQWWRLRMDPTTRSADSLAWTLLVIVFFGLAAPRLEAIQAWLHGT